ncbi:hypothetical protein DENIS_0604 [Desulfonema ishimotonii]|uniref:Uncharacterized protein n=1 Tax=Desulfonema ishimotonii TaxID=45657 RepID=A0A401FRT6_9BACT|nr:hypothetical protein [Desulfonema ishimotonii]GBC59663.1 hypothetical protein DENIS_0604 [Desulfonema ishimotonii]
MIFYDTIYRLNAQDKKASEAPENPSCAWRLRVIDFAAGAPDVVFLRPFIAVTFPLHKRIFPKSCLECMGEKIFSELMLSIPHLIWLECFPDLPEKMYTARFRQKSAGETDLLYTVTWRASLPNEIDAIRHFIPEITDVLSCVLSY